MNQKKCAFKDHKEIDAICFCQECKIYMCNKCANYHTGLFEKHQQYNLDKDIKEIFTGLCKEENHPNKLNYFCKTHNKLCCAACIAKIKDKGDGQHKDCEVCIIENIKDDKKNKLKQNIKCLEELSNKFEESINELKKIFEKISKDKEELKLKIQKIFTKIRNTLNEREDELLLEVDKEFNEKYFNEEIIKQSEKLPNKIKISLEKGKIIDKEWNDNNLNKLINDCINIEDNIKYINILNDNIKKCNYNINSIIQFFPEDKEIDDFLVTIKSFGKINFGSNCFKFKKCPLNINETRKYIVTGEKENIFTKTGKDGWMGTICEKMLEKSKENKWKIKILHTRRKSIMVGVAPIDFDINSSFYNTCGWYYNIYASNLYSGPPHNYSGKETNLSKVKNDEIIVVMDMNKRTLKFIINNEDKGDSYTDIPLDKPIFPAVLLSDQNDSVEIIEY